MPAAVKLRRDIPQRARLGAADPAPAAAARTPARCRLAAAGRLLDVALDPITGRITTVADCDLSAITPAPHGALHRRKTDHHPHCRPPALTSLPRNSPARFI